MNRLSKARQAAHPASDRNTPSPTGFGLFLQETGKGLEHYADRRDPDQAIAEAEQLFDAREACELILVWDYTRQQPSHLLRLTPATFPRWSADTPARPCQTPPTDSALYAWPGGMRHGGRKLNANKKQKGERHR